MSRPAVFFDRDNTLIANGDYLGDPAGVILIDGAADAVARVRSLGFATVVVSNQSGVARGMFDEEVVRAVNDRMDAMLVQENPDAVIERHEFSPHHPKGTVEAYRGESARRKPQPGMLLDAAEAMGLDLARSWLIGDAPRDVEAGQRAGCRTILVRDPSLRAESPAAAEPMTVTPDYPATSLADAIDFIEMQLESADDGLTDPPDPHVTLSPTVIAPSAVTTATMSSRRPTIEILDNDDPSIPEGIEVPIPSVTGALGAMSDAVVQSAPPTSSEKQTVLLLERVVEELRRANDPPQDFSVARMLAGVVQGFAIAAMFGALLFRNEPASAGTFNTLMLLAIFLQAMVSSMVLMGR